MFLFINSTLHQVPFQSLLA